MPSPAKSMSGLAGLFGHGTANCLISWILEPILTNVCEPWIYDWFDHDDRMSCLGCGVWLSG